MNLHQMAKKAINLEALVPGKKRHFKVMISNVVDDSNKMTSTLRVVGECSDKEVVLALAQMLAAVNQKMKELEEAGQLKK